VRSKFAYPPLAALLVATGVLTSCSATAAPEASGTASAAPEQPRPPVVQPGAPGESSRTLASGEAREGSGPPHVEADVRFMQDMIVHHLQALEMAALAPDRTERPDILLLARRIERGQGDEIALMERWLEERGETAAGAHAHHGHGDVHSPLMPGMIAPEQMEALAAAEGERFDRLFLQLMIRHHEGALRMVEELFETEGAAQEGEIFQFAAHVDGDQRIEIGRMLRMLGGSH
jgi:uncharacterized protein (DUF305 family)